MLPSEVTDIADLIFPKWRRAEEEVQRDILASAWKIHNAEKSRADLARQEYFALRAPMNHEIDRQADLINQLAAGLKQICDLPPGDDERPRNIAFSMLAIIFPPPQPQRLSNP